LASRSILKDTPILGQASAAADLILLLNPQLKATAQLRQLPLAFHQPADLNPVSR